MDGQQKIVDYIAEQLRAGHSEANLRQHLEAHGWASTALDSAFEQYHQDSMPKPMAMSVARRTYKPRLPRWTRARFIKVGVAFAGAAALGIGAFVFWPGKPAQTVAAKPLSYSQKQTSDVVTLGGAVGNYVQSAGVGLPMHTGTADDGNVLLCADICDATAQEVSQMLVYKASGVEILSYSSGLQAPNKDTIYIVRSGSCANSNELGGENVNVNAAVILYAREESGQLLQRCVKL